MGLLENLVFVLMSAGLALAGVATRRNRLGPSGLWAGGWIVLLSAGIILRSFDSIPGAGILISILTPIFPAFMLAGSYRYSGRPIPSWLVIITLFVSTLRGFLASIESVQAEALVALASGPALLIGSAIILYPAVRERGSILQGVLIPGLVLLAGVEISDALSGLLGWATWNAMTVWLALGVPVATLQFVAILELMTQRLDMTSDERDAKAAALASTVGELKAAHRHMEERIEARTLQLRRQVAENERIQDVLQLSEERYRNASELASDFSYAARLHRDGSLEMEWLTGAFERITGYSNEEVTRLDWASVAHSDDYSRIIECLKTVVEGGEDEFECRLRTKDGSQRWIFTHCQGVREESTGDLIVYSAGHDITERKASERENSKLRERVREVQKLESLGALAGGIAHDFNNLLSVILGNASLLMRELPEDSPLSPRAQRIRNSARYAAELTEKMLTYAGSAPKNSDVLDLSILAEEMSELVLSGADHPIDFEVDLPVPIPRIQGDATQIRQLILNLLTNAHEALGDHAGRVNVSTGVVDADHLYLADARAVTDLAAGEYVYLEVADTGHGMNETTIERLFEPFYTTKQTGRGLGLAVVVGIVRSHNGAIKVDSEPGLGTTFRVLFPIHRDEVVQDAAVAETCEEFSNAHEGATILVIDDEEPVRELAEAFLGAEGYEVLLASSGEEGLDVFDEKARDISLVLLDLTMPGVGGGEVLAELRNADPNLPIIILSGYTHEIAARRAGNPESTEFLQKPYEPEDLTAGVRRLLATSAN